MSLANAVARATRDAAASVGDGAWRGRLAPGCAANVAVYDDDPFAAGSAALLRTRAVRTVVAGRVVFAAEEAAVR